MSSLLPFFTMPLLLVALLLLMSCRDTAGPFAPAITDTPTDSTADLRDLRYLALGDSYTIGESVPEAERWPNLLSDRLRDARIFTDTPEIIATTGWTTGNLLSALYVYDPQPEYDLVSLLIGVNNQYQGRSLSEYRTQFEELLLQALALAQGDTGRVFVVSIPDYGYTPFGAGQQAAISAEIDLFNAAAKEITETYGIAWYDITDISREGLDDPALVAADGLHPSGEQYARWAERIVEGVAAQVRD